MIMRLCFAICLYLLVGGGIYRCESFRTYLEIKRAKQIEDAVEHALIKDELNAYRLEKAFYSSDPFPVSYLSVLYTVFANANGQYEVNIYIRTWCKSNIYSMVSPIMMRTLFPGLMYRVHFLHNHEILAVAILNLNFIDEVLPSNTLKEEIGFVVDGLTPRLKQYTNAKEITPLTKENTGYNCNIQSHYDFLAFIQYVMAFGSLLVAVKVLSSISETNKMFKQTSLLTLSIFGCSLTITDLVFTTLQLYELLQENVQLSTADDVAGLKKLKESYQDIPKHCITKGLQISFGLLIIIVSGVIGACKPTLILKSPIWSNCPCAVNRIANLIFFSFYFYLSYMVGLSILPTILILSITPIKTITVLMLIVSFVATYAILFFIFIDVCPRTRNIKDAIKSMNINAFVYPIAFILLNIILLSYFYTRTLVIEDEQLSVQVLISWASPLIPISLANKFLKKQLLKIKETKPGSAIEDGGTETELTVEEGRTEPGSAIGDGGTRASLVEPLIGNC